MAERFEIVAAPEDKGARLDRFLSDRMGVTRSTVERLLSEGVVTVLGGDAVKNYRLRGGECVSVTVEDPAPAEAQPENIPLDIVYEDEDIIVVNKPQGMVVHPAAGNESGTLVNALLYHCRDSLSGIGGAVRPGIVHRIDKDTSGLMVVAKCDEAHLKLSEELKHHGIEREYHALVVGGFGEDSGTVDYPIGRHPTDRKKMAVILDGSGTAKEARTHYSVVERFGNISYLRLNLETGRTHQIRVHMSYIGHPLLGDPVYLKNRTLFETKHPSLFHGQMLHAGKLSLTHPKTGERMIFEAPLPHNFSEALRIVRDEAYK